MTITVNPKITPTFTPVAAVCSGATISALPTTANGISGNWSPAINNTATTPYTFTPDAGQCANNATMTITVNPKITPTFTPVAAVCSGATISALPTTANGISGNWSPALNNLATTPYTFTPDAGQCANNATMTITVNPKITPTFTPVAAVCSGATISALPTTANGISGNWSPALNNLATTPYTFIPDAGQCANNATMTITVNPSNTLKRVRYTVTDAFENNQIITVFAEETGNYLYQLDSGPSQTSPIFENVSSGIHTITVSDVNGCSDSISVNDILVIKHPKFFTPNGDNYNDTWEISDLSNFISKIYIFDRYGKILKEISPAGLGWDGTYLGVPMPADDYWFNIEYIKNSVMKNFKSHFSLKR
jgi:gliding motility-associated-like protein